MSPGAPTTTTPGSFSAPGRAGLGLDKGRSGQGRSGAHCTLTFFFCFVSSVLAGRLGEVEGEGAQKLPGEDDGCLEMGAAQRTNEARTRQQHANGLGNISIHPTKREMARQPANVPFNLLNSPRRGKP